MLADAILARPAEVERGEAAIAVAQEALDPDDARLLLEALDLADAPYRWNVTRAAQVIVGRARLGAEFSVNTCRLWLPGRAHWLLPVTFRQLGQSGLIAPTGRQVESAADGARRRLVPCYRLTRAGEDLSARIAPLPGMGLLTTKII